MSPSTQPNHTYAVEFRFYGEALDLAEVSSIMGLQATNSSHDEPIGKRPKLSFRGL
ncbi:hypothetical protein [Sphingomonas sp. Leaf357]|uniref:hypothetical protein n=1 Tax=Sphingomonas sp. Leaf357 TaxID=1736350 RepID=UPI000AF64D58|nr:hypothetical protein [Sphingomonas sp. Leaf357]